jgi:hypothetical protein
MQWKSFKLTKVDLWIFLSCQNGNLTLIWIKVILQVVLPLLLNAYQVHQRSVLGVSCAANMQSQLQEQQIARPHQQQLLQQLQEQQIAVVMS